MADHAYKGLNAYKGLKALTSTEARSSIMKGGNSLVVALTLAAAGSAAWLPRNADGKNYLDTAGLSQNNKALFNYAMPILDSNFGLPLL
jgi:hypothetical protein